MSFGKLYLIPVPLADDTPSSVFTEYARQTIEAVDEYIVENEKTARKFLKQAGMTRPQSELILHDYGKHRRRERSSKDFLRSVLAGKDVGLMSEAGSPGIADPGADIVAEAHRLGIRVVPLVGPSSILLALMASGLNGQSFAFHGYLPIDKSQRFTKIKELERTSKLNRQTQIFIETPYRNEHLLRDLLSALQPETMLCVATDLTAPSETVIRQSIADWKRLKRDKNTRGDLHKRPSVFLILAF